MKTNAVFLMGTVLVLVALSCEKPHAFSDTELPDRRQIGTCTVDTLAAKTLETEYGCINTRFNMRVALRDTFTTVSQFTQFDSLVSGSCKPAIDFSVYNLLIGNKQLLSGSRAVDYRIVRDCPKNTLTVEVFFTQEASAMAPAVTYHALLPKLRQNEVVKVVHIFK